MKRARAVNSLVECRRHVPGAAALAGITIPKGVAAFRCWFGSGDGGDVGDGDGSGGGKKKKPKLLREISAGFSVSSGGDGVMFLFFFLSSLFLSV